MTLKQLEVQIMGQSYLLGAPEGGEQQLLTAVEKVDTAMCKIRDAGKVKARDRIAVLAALNLAFETDRPSVNNAAQSNAVKAAPVSGSQADAGLDDPRWATLVHRLDLALGSDGQLL
jgi:cell division protein ZapA